MSARRRFSERQVLETLIHRGHEIRCFRTKEVLTLETVKFVEREHLVPRALGGSDLPENAAYSLKAAHAIVTNGKPHTKKDGDKHKIAMAKAHEKAREQSEALSRGELIYVSNREAFKTKRKVRGPGFPKGHRPMNWRGRKDVCSRKTLGDV